MSGKELEMAINGDVFAVDVYLSDVSTEQFCKDVKEYAAQYANVGAIKKAIELLDNVLQDHEINT